jgi:hypothetical protein
MMYTEETEKRTMEQKFSGAARFPGSFCSRMPLAPNAPMAVWPKVGCTQQPSEMEEGFHSPSLVEPPHPATEPQAMRKMLENLPENDQKKLHKDTRDPRRRKCWRDGDLVPKKTRMVIQGRSLCRRPNNFKRRKMCPQNISDHI